MKARLIKKAEVSESQTVPEQTEKVLTTVSEVVEWVRETRESMNPNRGPNARERFASLFAHPQITNG
ncbi:MAG: hypothetical protein ABI882_04355 [Acidobacteriota bacterium]